PLSGGGDGSDLEGLTLEEVRADPVGSRGAIVTWELQKISLERADAGRVEFAAGEPYLLMRPADLGTGRFVYVTIPEGSVQDAQDFAPLERFTVRGRVRAGASPITGGPVIELIEMVRSRGPR
ncbi:MAG: hypothetical protein RQ745_14115, partial [Longimicrobiales bacterium]|nr:hypothetical protein [Longimicrobiales bacterium]